MRGWDAEEAVSCVVVVYKPFTGGGGGAAAAAAAAAFLVQCLTLRLQIQVFKLEVCYVTSHTLPHKLIVRHSYATGEAAMMAALVSDGPVAVSMAVYENFFHYKEGVYQRHW